MSTLQKQNQLAFLKNLNLCSKTVCHGYEFGSSKRLMTNWWHNWLPIHLSLLQWPNFIHVEFLSFGFWQVVVRRPCLDNIHGAFWSWICKRNLMTWNMYELQWSFNAYHFTLNWKVGCKTFGLNWIELRWKVFIVKETHFCMVKWACMSHITSRVMTRQCFACPWQMVNCLMMFGRFIVHDIILLQG